MNPVYTARGILQIAATNGSKPVPVEGAQVRVTDPTDGTVVMEGVTDSSGQTGKMELPAPPASYSLEESDQRPYAVYNVTVTAGGFERLHIGGVQLLADNTAIQRAQLAPERQSGFNVRNIQLAPHTLWGDFPPKIPEAEVKDLPEPEGLVVLPEPVIPEFIVVHLGRPEDRSARNVWIYFKDYIKNVACSEVYPTWNAEAIKANVLAIISFTLNRVYTEWYRGKGYDFTITNSTALDQSFVFERTIFEDISTIVDDIFTTYITRPDIVQPLLTQYCDGKRTQCSGLSQWGSQALGQQGLDAISILRHYYGSDIYLTSAKKVQGVPQSYGGAVLAQGSSGEDVRTIQNQLNRIADNFPAIPKLRADGVFGTATENAVRTFQQIFNLPQDGKVGFATWYEISNIYVAVTKIA